MDLILWRHAEAEDGAPDAERRLTSKGRKQAKEMGAWLNSRLPKHVRLLSSPAVRARQTAEALGMPLEISEDLSTSADVKDLLRAAGWPSGDGIVILVGHQPTLGQLAALLVTGQEASWEVRKGAVWWLRRIRNSNAEILAVVPPKLL